MNVVVVHCNCGDVAQPAPRRPPPRSKSSLVRRFRCSSANTASMIGMVTSAVRDTTTNIMLGKQAERDRREQQREPRPAGPQQRRDRIGRRRSRFLALVVSFLTKIPRNSASRLRAWSGSKATAQDTSISSVQARKATKTHRPRGQRWK